MKYPRAYLPEILWGEPLLELKALNTPPLIIIY